MTQLNIIDTAAKLIAPSHNFLPALKTKGVTHCFRYLSRMTPGDNWKIVTRKEVEAAAQYGIRIIANYETRLGATASYFTEANGYLDGKYAREYGHNELKMENNNLILFSSEAKFDSAYINQNIKPYFKGIERAFNEQRDLPKYKVGAYSAGNPLAALLDARLTEITWLANAMGWNGSKQFLASNRWHIRQHLTVKNYVTIPNGSGNGVIGLDVDPDTLNPTYGEDILGAIPVGNIVITPPPTPIIPMTIRQGASGPIVRQLQPLVGVQVDGVFGPNTLLAVKRYQQANGLIIDGVVGPNTWKKLLGYH